MSPTDRALSVRGDCGGAARSSSGKPRIARFYRIAPARTYTPNPARIAPEIPLTHLRPARLSLSRNTPTPPLRISHHVAEPMNTPNTILPAETRVPLVLTTPQPGEYRRKGKDGHRVGECQKEGRGVSAGEPLSPVGGGSFCGFRKQSLQAQITEKHAAAEFQPYVLADQEVRNEGQPESGDATINGVGRGSAKTGNEARQAPFGQGAAYAENADGPYRSGDGKADGKAAEQVVHGSSRVGLRQPSGRKRSSAFP